MNLVESERDKFSEDWWSLVSREFDQDYMKLIYSTIIHRKNEGATIYPSSNDVYKVFDQPFKDIKVVILGQD